MIFYDDITYRSALGRALGYCVVLMGGEAVYVEGITRYSVITPERIEMIAGRKLIVVEGSDMRVEELERETVIVKGRIRSVREEGECIPSERKD